MNIQGKPIGAGDVLGYGARRIKVDSFSPGARVVWGRYMDTGVFVEARADALYWPAKADNDAR